jgi:hypothetical protein
MVKVEGWEATVVKLITEGDRVHDAFAGRPLHVSSTEPKFAAVGITVTENVPLWPCLTVEEEGFTVTVKSAGGGGSAGVPAYS